MDRFINWEIAGNWYNWVQINLMIVLVVLFLALLFPQIAQAPTEL